MSQENVEILRRFAEVFETGDLERIVSEFFDPEIEWRTSAEDPDAATHRGPEAYKRYVEQWWESFEGLHAEVEEYIDAGDDNRKLCSLYLSLMDRMGMKADKFGDATTPLAGL